MVDTIACGILIILGLILVLVALRFTNRFTSMKNYQCKQMANVGMNCNIYRVPKNLLFRYFGMVVPLKRYGCQDCGHNFTRLKRFREEVESNTVD